MILALVTAFVLYHRTTILNTRLLVWTTSSP